MTGVPLETIRRYLDELLDVTRIQDYPPALNGVQVSHRGPVTRLAAAVDASQRTIDTATKEGANLLLVHHGLFWNGLQPLTGPHLDRVRALLDADLALYSAHLPLDAHDRFGNSRLLAAELGLEVTGGFARYQTIDCGVSGESDLDTRALVDRVRAWAAPLDHHTIASMIPDGHRTRRWAICSGSGARVETLREACAIGVNTLIVGEGPHWSAVDAPERGLVIVYAGHYATETLGVRALTAHLAERFGLPWSFVHAPTGL